MMQVALGRAKVKLETYFTTENGCASVLNT